MIALALVVAAGLLALAMYYVIRGPNLPVRSLAELENYSHPVDLAAFRHLVDPSELEFLRRNLSARNFARLRKQRNRVVLLYLSDIARNCVLLMRIGEAALDDPNPAVAQAAKVLVDRALECRVLALKEMLRMRLLRLSGERLTGAYSALSESLGRFSMEKEPAMTSRVLAYI